MNNQCMRHEVGYVLLEECEILLLTDLSSPSVDAAFAEWYNLSLRSDSAGNQNGEDDEANGASHLNDGGRDLILRPCISAAANSESNSNSWTNATSIIPFNGLVSEVAIEKPSQTLTNNESPFDLKRRSDASLLVGLALEINQQQEQGSTQHNGESNGKLEGNGGRFHLRQLRMESAQVMFWEHYLHNSENANNTAMSAQESSSSTVTRTKASILVTFSLPNHTQNINPGIMACGKDLNHVQTIMAKPRYKAKVLSTAHQLIGSIIRCDWSHLDRTKKLLQHKALSPRKKQTSSGTSRPNSSLSPFFFPDSLSIENLYERIGGASAHFSHDVLNHRETRVSSKSCSSKRLEFLDLPSDIIATSIATYLRSKSLHALRATNRKLFVSLREVVPGLRLKLFQHQIRSLEWMEMRERRCITEGDLIGSHEQVAAQDYFLDESEVVCGGDYHRAVTGGATVLLTPRSNSSCSIAPGPIRFNLASGCEIASFVCASGSKTNCARGG